MSEFDPSDVPGAYRASGEPTRSERLVRGLKREPGVRTGVLGRSHTARKFGMINLAIAVTGAVSLLCEPAQASEIRLAIRGATSQEVTLTVRQDPVVREFFRLRDAWLGDTKAQMGGVADTDHPAYRSIIGLGAPVVPLLLNELRSRSGDWQNALSAITGVDPVPEEDWGDYDKAVQHWLDWGRKAGFGG